MNSVTPEEIVEMLLENDYQGPPAPDNFLNAVGSLRDMRALQRKAAQKMYQLDSALQYERQLRKLGLRKEQIKRYIRAESEYPGNYIMGRPRTKNFWPANTIVGVETNDDQKIIFDIPIVPDENPVDIHPDKPDQP